MNPRWIPIWTMLILFCGGSFLMETQAQTTWADHVDPLIGTKGLFTYGRTTPFVTPPFGMTHWTPMTNLPRIGWCPYRYGQQKIIGFRGSHKPAMWMADYGYLTLMPGLGKIETAPKRRGLTFEHSRENAHPHHYEVALFTETGEQIKVEMTATAHCGFFRFRYPVGTAGYLLMEASHKKDFPGQIQIDYDNWEISGFNSDKNHTGIGPDKPVVKGYFVLQFDRPFAKYGVYAGKRQFEGREKQEGNNVGAFVRFIEGEEGPWVKVRIGTSFISIDQARKNLQAELPEAQSFAQIEENLKATWNQYLSRIQIEGATPDEEAVFYTALYHSLLFPRTFSEQGKYYSPFDGKVHDGVSYTDYSLWDTYRAQHPLLLFTAPEHVPGMMQSLVQHYEEGGWLPKWPNPGYSNIMIGTHADAVLADAYVKGVRGFDAATAYEAMYKNAMTPPEGDDKNRWKDRAKWTAFEARGGLSAYKNLGYVPIDQTAESVSRTLEFAYGDFCVAQMASALGKLDDFELFRARSGNYANVYNGHTGFMAPRSSGGDWHKKTAKGFTEGSPWTYLFCVTQDIPGLIDLMGSATFAEKLEQNFSDGHYVHTNEPGHHYAYLFNYIDKPWRTQELVAQIRAEHYKNAPDGLTGDDDCGQMSAWYVFSALGFYPVTPGSELYAIGVPQFERAVIQLDPNTPEKRIEILAKGISSTRVYAKSITWNGEKLTEPFIRHSDLMKGGILAFEMVEAKEVKKN